MLIIGMNTQAGGSCCCYETRAGSTDSEMGVPLKIFDRNTPPPPHLPVAAGGTSALGRMHLYTASGLAEVEDTNGGGSEPLLPAW
jgi:hypothetical protein